jgi:hypothetical protein
MPTGRNDAYLVSTLDSRMRLMDKASGKLLQTFESDNVRMIVSSRRQLLNGD